MPLIEFAGVAAAIVVFVFLFWLTVRLYFFVRRKWAHVKYSVEILFIGTAIILSIAVKILVFCMLVTTNEFLDGINSCIKAIYSGIGGLTFEGLPDFGEDELHKVWQCLYFSSSLYAGAVTLFIVSAKASYEFYSALELARSERKRNVYVISAVTEESLYLARSIKEKDPKAVVVFAGPTLDAFDSHDDLCRQVMAGGFLYWSYSKGIKRHASIARTLSLNNHNGGKDGVTFTNDNYKRRFVVYAFGTKDHIPLEEENLDIVFDDIEERINHPDKLRIEYYLLTKREINFQAYNYRNREMMLMFAEKRNFSATTGDSDKNILFDEKFRKYFLSGSSPADLDESWKKFKAQIEETYSKYIVLNIWCEALAIGRQTIMAMNKMGFAQQLANDEKGLRVWSLGFGVTGQSITNELFVQSAGVDSTGRARDYMVDVFDKDVLDLGGMFKTKHSGYCYLYDSSIESNKTWQTLQNDFEEWQSDFGRDKRCVEICHNHLLDTALPLYLREEQFQNSKQHPEMPMPLYRLHNVSCTEIEFFRRIDKATGKEANYQITLDAVRETIDLMKKSKSEKVNGVLKLLEKSVNFMISEAPQVIVVSTGDDYRDISIANALIHDITSEQTGKVTSKQYIIVNVWDRHNNPLLISSKGVWNKDHDILTSDGLVVIVVGNNDKIYTYDSTVMQEKEERYNFTYLGMCEWLSSNDSRRQNTALMLQNPQKPWTPADYDAAKSILNDCHNHIDLLYRALHGESVPQAAGLHIMGNLFQRLFSGENYLPAEKYSLVDIWKRESNKSATLFAPMLSELYKVLDSDNSPIHGKVVEIFSRLSIAEHCRWVRMHIANGWTYSDVRDDGMRHHNCIAAFSQLKETAILYDTLNAFWAIVSEQHENK